MAFRGGWFHTISGNESNYFLRTSILELKYNVTRQWSLAVEAGQFILKGYYKEFPDTKRDYPYGRLSAGYRFQF